MGKKTKNQYDYVAYDFPSIESTDEIYLDARVRTRSNIRVGARRMSAASDRYERRKRLALSTPECFQSLIKS